MISPNRSLLNRRSLLQQDPFAQMPDPNGIQMGQMAAPGGKIKGPSLLERFKAGIMPSPETGGLLGDGDVQNARHQGLLGLGAGLLAASGPRRAEDRVGLMQAVGQGIQGGQQAYQGALQGAAGQKMAEQQYAGGQLDQQLGGAQLAQQAMEMQQATAMANGRKAIIEKYGQPKVGDPGSTAQWIDAVTPELIKLGDTETLGRLSEVRKTLGGQQGKEPGTWVTVPGPDGKPMRQYVRESQGPVQEYEEPTPRDAGATLLDMSRMASLTDKHRDNYIGVTKEIAKAANQYRTFTASVDLAKQGNPAAQIALVFSFMKTLDPSSVVRESEYATAENARGVPESIRNQWNKVLDGSRLTPSQIDNFASSAQSAAQAWKKQQDYHTKVSTGRAGRWKVNPDDVSEDFFDGLPLEEPGPFGSVQSGGASTAAPGSGIRNRWGSLK